MNDLAYVDRPLPVGSMGHQASGFWGMLCLIATEGALFAFLLFSYFYTALLSVGPWPPTGPPHLRLAGPNTAILIASSLCVAWAERSIRRHDSRWRLSIGLFGGLVLGTVFVAVQLLEWRDKPFSIDTGAYGSLFFTITGFHMAHVIVGLLVLAAMLVWSLIGYFGRGRHAAVTIGALYWHFVDVVWLFVFVSLYLWPHLGLM